MATNNAHVFISYSRRNIDFAKLLYRELNKSKRDVWVDWEDIPRGADWMQEIYNGIDNSDTFIFLVSEHSLVSEVCNQELHYAIKRHKKIIPIILQDINDDVHQRVQANWRGQDWNSMAQDNWTALKHINWIFFNNPARYKDEFQALLHTVDQDLFHIKMHTRLLVRATEWDNAGRNDSSLLQGDDLIGAEHWLKTYTDTDPKPTQLHRDFISASRDEENAKIAHEQRLQRSARIRLQILVGSFVILTGVIVFALLPIINRQVETQLADEIDERLSEAAISFRDLLDEDEELAIAAARFVSNLPVMEVVNVWSDEEIRRELMPVRDDFDLQEISVYGTDFWYGQAPAFYLGPDINHNARVQRIREDVVLNALEFETAVSDIVIGSPESQIISASPIFGETPGNQGEVIGVVLVAFHLNDEYIEELAIILNIEAVIANLEGQIVATTFSNPQELGGQLNTYLVDTYDYEVMVNGIRQSYFDYILDDDGNVLRMVTSPLLLISDVENASEMIPDDNSDAIQEGVLFVGSSFESVIDLQATVQTTVVTFAAIIAGVVIVLLVFLIGIPVLNRSRQRG